MFWPNAWPHPFQSQDANTRSRWGYTFQVTGDHLTPEQSLPLKHSYDVLGEECLDVLNEICPAETKDFVRLDNPPPDGQRAEKPPPTTRKAKRDLFVLLRDNHNKHPKLQEFWDEVTTTPPWVDWEQIRRGQEVFYRYGGATLTGLAYQSLLGGMGAARVVEVLSRTGGFSVKVARHRLFETTQHLLSCTLSLDSIQTPSGDGFASSIRVRLLHAAVRKRIMALAKTRPDYYSVEKYGIPINDLDCMATIGTFSATILFISLPRQLIFPTSQEITDYIALWRLIAHYTGTPTEYFATPAKAKAVMETLLYYEIDPSPTSATLANNIILALADTPPAYASTSFLTVNARWLNGNALCNALKLPKPHFYYWALMLGQCFFFAGICYTYRSIPSWDRAKIKALRNIFWQMIVEGKYGLKGERSVFEFKYVPDFGVQTLLGDGGGEGKGQGKGKEESTIPEIGRRGVEMRNLQTLGIAMAGATVCCWVGLKIVTSIVAMIR
jgi:hypothetical protein